MSSKYLYFNALSIYICIFSCFIIRCKDTISFLHIVNNHKFCTQLPSDGAQDARESPPNPSPSFFCKKQSPDFPNPDVFLPHFYLFHSHFYLFRPNA
jgi:hypothetical protein